jgi:hypothetical protein
MIGPLVSGSVTLLEQPHVTAVSIRQARNGKNLVGDIVYVRSVVENFAGKVLRGIYGGNRDTPANR